MFKALMTEVSAPALNYDTAVVSDDFGRSNGQVARRAGLAARATLSERGIAGLRRMCRPVPVALDWDRWEKARRRGLREIVHLFPLVPTICHLVPQFSK
jgi:hypothetical protein